MTVDYENMEAVRCWWFGYYLGKDFCSVHLFRGPRSWTDSVQMKSSMTIDAWREKDDFENREVKHFNECALALSCTSVKYMHLPRMIYRIWCLNRYPLQVHDFISVGPVEL